jgi:hypothetical protein
MAEMSPTERVSVSTLAGQLFVEVWLVEDDAFRRDATLYEASLSDRKFDVLDPAAARMKSWSVEAVNDRGHSLDIMHKRSGGTGAETHLEWILVPVDDGHPVDVSIRREGDVVWSAYGFIPAIDEHHHRLSADALQILRPFPKSN